MTILPLDQTRKNNSLGPMKVLRPVLSCLVMSVFDFCSIHVLSCPVMSVFDFCSVLSCLVLSVFDYCCLSSSKGGN